MAKCKQEEFNPFTRVTIAVSDCDPKMVKALVYDPSQPDYPINMGERVEVKEWSGDYVSVIIDINAAGEWAVSSAKKLQGWLQERLDRLEALRRDMAIIRSLPALPLSQEGD